MRSDIPKLTEAELVRVSLSFARTLLLAVFPKTVKRPFRVFAQMCVKPRKSDVSGMPFLDRATR